MEKSDSGYPAVGKRTWTEPLLDSIQRRLDDLVRGIRSGLRLNFDGAGVRLEDDLPDCALKSGLFFFGRKARLFNTCCLQYGAFEFVRTHQNTLARFAASGG